MSVTSYSQFLEDVRLYRALKGVGKGFYIDVGANHPTDHSVTKLFYDLGWSGINIEPSPRWFRDLEQDRPRDINIQVAATDENGTAIFYDFTETGLSTLSAELVERHTRTGFLKTSYLVTTRKLSDICRDHVHDDVHFLKIDAEGSEAAVIEGFDFTICRPWLLVIESSSPAAAFPDVINWDRKLFANGYSFAGNDFVNRYYVSNDHSELLPLVSAPVDEYQRMSDPWATRLLPHERIPLEIEISNLKKELSETKAQLAAIADSTSWRALAPIRAIVQSVRRYPSNFL